MGSNNGWVILQQLQTHIAQVIPWDVLISFQIVDQHIPTSGEVSHVEGVVAAETQATATACMGTQRSAFFGGQCMYGVAHAKLASLHTIAVHVVLV